LVDEILDLVPGKHIRATKTLGQQEEFFRDHFPGFPVVPGVLLTEMMAQTAGKCLDAENPKRGKAMLAQIKMASFREWVSPGQVAMIFAQIRSSRPQFATADCYVEVEGRKVCSAELFFTFVTADRFAADYRDEVLERYRTAHGKSETGPKQTPRANPD
jgi:3-hydroxyacyl-[acyl-carrier-protein] dehydratase